MRSDLSKLFVTNLRFVLVLTKLVDRPELHFREWDELGGMKTEFIDVGGREPQAFARRAGLGMDALAETVA